MNKTPAEIDKVRKDIKDYEKHKRAKHLSTATGLASLGAVGYGAFADKKKILYPALAAAFASGFGRGHAKKEEQAALNRVKRFYDLRTRSPGPQSEKVAVLAGAAHTALHLVAPEVAGMIPPELITATDVALLPKLTDIAKKKNLDYAEASVKNVMGKSLSAKDKSLLSGAMKAQSYTQRLDELASKIDVTNPIGFAVHKGKDYLKSLVGIMPSYTGGHLGEVAGPVMKEINKYSPRHADAILGASKLDPKGVSHLKDMLHQDASKIQEAGRVFNSTIDEVPFLRRVLRSTGRSSTDTIKKVLQEPQVAVDMANTLKDVVKSTVRSGKYVGLGAGLALAGAGIGGLKKRHALAKDELPKALTDKKKEELNVLPFKSKS